MTYSRACGVQTAECGAFSCRCGKSPAGRVVGQEKPAQQVGFREWFLGLLNQYADSHPVNDNPMQRTHNESREGC